MSHSWAVNDNVFTVTIDHGHYVPSFLTCLRVSLPTSTICIYAYTLERSVWNQTAPAENSQKVTRALIDTGKVLHWPMTKVHVSCILFVEYEYVLSYEWICKKKLIMQSDTTKASKFNLNNVHFIRFQIKHIAKSSTETMFISLKELCRDRNESHTV